MIDEGKCQNWHQINEHWRPQSANCPFCHFKYQVYGHYETAEEDTAYILLKSNLTGKLKKVGKINSSHNLNPQERRNAFWKAVPAHYVLDLKKMFYWDFKLFDYNWPRSSYAWPKCQITHAFSSSVISEQQKERRQGHCQGHCTFSWQAFCAFIFQMQFSAEVRLTDWCRIFRSQCFFFKYIFITKIPNLR